MYLQVRQVELFAQTPFANCAAIITMNHQMPNVSHRQRIGCRYESQMSVSV